MKKLYLYGVIEASEDSNFGVVDMKAAEPDVIQVKSHNGLGIIYTDMALGDEEEIQATRKNLLNHQKVIERVMEAKTVLPFSFGLVVKNETDLIEIIEEKHDFFREKLTQISGKIELNLKGVWDDMSLVYQTITANNQDINDLKSRLLQQEFPDQADKIELGKMVEYALTLEKERLSDKIIGALSDKFEDYRMNKNITESMFCNLAFMIDASREGEFDDAINALGDELSRNITFKYVGPLPPYNFLD